MLLLGLCNLKRLKEIDLSANDLIGELPRCLSNLTSLQVIDISRNLFRIPLSLSPFFNHSRLKEFSGGDNSEIYGDKHKASLSRMFQIESLDLSRNNLSGGIFPKFLYYQHELEMIDISNIKLEGAGFPSWLLVNNTSLRDLTLINCSLSGSFQFPIYQHPVEDLDGLDISNNNLYSPIPSHICALESLSLSENRLLGRIPEHLSNCSMLFSLDASNNHLSGKIPRWIWKFPHLQVLDLSRNKFSGSLPLGFITSQIREVYLSRNLLGGTLTKGDGAHNDYSSYPLNVLDLSHNQIKGTIPRWISILPRLNYLLLNNNEFYGEIPIPFTLEQVKLIVISHNHFSGQLSSVLTSNISTVSYNGYITKDLELVTKTNLYTYKGKPLDSLSGFDFSNNNFSGEIPPQISYKDDMKFLNLSNNQLKGSIPPSFSRLLQIESLDLSHNNLSGTIPSELAALTFLGSFSVAYNNLSGKCPQAAQFATFKDSSYEGNPYLCCTFPLPPSGPLLTPPASYDGDDDYGGSFIDMESFYASSGVSFVMVLLIIASVLYINPYWRGVWFYLRQDHHH
ncbi:unnamed protein product [Linum tenue]|uniref:Uncharacterized protein n=1 Tax=Linum tenue TaxID=586396 RepID=A0AAV0QBZ2_9ROSI|nr:unnamed protein product [Linum tenue]